MDLCRWRGNNKLQFYTKDLKNVHVTNGVLKITALKEHMAYYLYDALRLMADR